jgi:hypothetical protein
MPAEWRDPTAGVTSPGGMGPYGAGRIPNNMTLTGSGGTVDPVALKILAQGGHYDMASRRDAIAQRLAANSAAQSAYDTARARPVSPYGMQQYDFPMPYAGGQ